MRAAKKRLINVNRNGKFFPLRFAVEIKKMFTNTSRRDIIKNIKFAEGEDNGKRNLIKFYI